MKPDPLERFFDKVEIADCWEWQAVVHRKGYGQFRADGTMKQAHRWLWQQLVGVLPRELELDHLCKNRRCVNPDHLEPVTHAENVRRSRHAIGAAVTRRWAEYHAVTTHCKNGHEFTEENTMRYSYKRQCRTCNREYSRAYHRARRDASSEFVN